MNMVKAMGAAAVLAVLGLPDATGTGVRAETASGPAALRNQTTPNDGAVWRIPTKCGKNCTYIMAKIIGSSASYEDVERRLPDSEKGNSLVEMRDCFRSIGLGANIARGTPDALLHAELPLIAHWEEESGNTGHYVVVIAVTPEGVQYVDGTTAAIAAKTFPEFLKKWSGYVLILDARLWWYPLVPAVATLGVMLVVLGLWGHRARLRQAVPGVAGAVSRRVMPEGPA